MSDLLRHMTAEGWVAGGVISFLIIAAFGAGLWRLWVLHSARSAVSTLEIDSSKRGDVGRAPDWLRHVLSEFRAGQHDSKALGGPVRTRSFTALVEEMQPRPDKAVLGELMPAVLTGLGIFGTFVGITIGLTQFKIGPAAASGTDMVKEVQELIPTLGIAFVTSILGLSLSLLLRVLLAERDGALHRALLAAGVRIDDSVPAWSAEGLQVAFLDRLGFEAARTRAAITKKLEAVGERHTSLIRDRLGEQGSLSVVELLEAQNTTLGGIGGDLADAVDNAIAKGFESALHGWPSSDGKPGSPGLLAQINDVVAQLKKSQADGAGQLADHLAEQIDVRLVARLDGFSEAVEGARAAAEHWTGGVHGLTGQVEAAAGMLDTAHSRLSSAVGQAEALAVRIEGFLSRMDGALRIQIEGMEGQERLLRNAVSGMEGQNERWKTQADQLRSLQEDLAGLAAAAQSIAGWHDAQKTLLQDQLDAWRGGLDEQRALTDAFSEERAKTTEMITTVEAAVTSFAELGTKLEGLSGTMRAELEGLEARRASTGETVDDAVENLRKLSATMQDAFDAYRQSAGALREGLPDVAHLLEQLRDASSTHESVVERTGLLAERIGAAAEAHERAAIGMSSMGKLPDALGPLLQSIQVAGQRLAETTGPLSSTASRLGAVAERLDGLDQRLAEADRQAADRWATTAQKMDQSREALHDTSQQLTAAVQDYVASLNAALADSTNQQHEQWGASLERIGQAMGALQGLANTLQESSHMVAESVGELAKSQQQPASRQRV